MEKLERSPPIATSAAPSPSKSPRARVSPKPEPSPSKLTADYLTRWNAAKENNRPGMVHQKSLEFIGISSGTSGVDKFIPFPDEQFANFRLFTNHAFFHAFHALNDATLLAKNILVTSGPPIREVTPSGITIGYGSGLATLKAPRFARQLVRPTRAVLEIPACSWCSPLPAP